MNLRVTDHLTIERRFAKSAHFERDAHATDPLTHYIITGTALDVTRRLIASVERGAGGAWSITGPYGSGKSSLGLFLAALFGPSDAPETSIAHRLLGTIDRDLLQRVDALPRGVARGLVTAQREPVTHTVTRALRSALIDHFGQIPQPRTFPDVRLLRAAEDDIQSRSASRTGPSPAMLVDLARSLARRVPVLLVIDELGKNLEAASSANDTDLYLLQLLADLTATERGAALQLVTLQHLSFGDYVESADTAKQREWIKIQGRFEDVAYIDSPAQTRELIRTGFRADEQLLEALRPWVKKHAKTMAAIGLPEFADPTAIQACYPLHPATTAVLPELCRRYGQNERTLFGFLTGAAPTAVPALIDSFVLGGMSAQVPAVGLPEVYDFFVQSAVISRVSGAARWNEIIARLRDTARLTSAAVATAKAIALLNLIATGGPLRASRALVQACVHDFDSAEAELIAAGVISYRPTSDEYRIWQGTDVDFERVITSEQNQLTSLATAQLLERARPLRPQLAAGHSLRTDTVRVFDRRYADRSSTFEPPPATSPFDGRAYLLVDDESPVAAMQRDGEKPVVIVHPKTDLDALRTSAVAALALQRALEHDLVSKDWVARREVAERLAEAQSSLDEQLDAALETAVSMLLTTEDPRTLDPGPGTAHLSQAALISYPNSPLVRNETINRTELTSQGAKARRELIDAMITRSSLPGLGLDGNGPEVAMYRAVLSSPGIHSEDTTSEEWTFRSPTAKSNFHPAWTELNAQLQRARDRRVNLNDLYAALQLPPYGVKTGVIPVLVVAALLATNDEVALYEHGTFRPALTSQIAERLVRNPGHFEVKHYANADGARRKVIEQLAETLTIPTRRRKQRVGNVLAVVTHVVTQIGALPPFVHRTADLTPDGKAVRDTIAQAVEPDELIFEAIPTALRLPPVRPAATQYLQAGELARRLKDALDALAACYPALLSGLRDELIVRSAHLQSRGQLAGEAASIAPEVLDPHVRAFVGALATPREVFDDDGWIENVATVLTKSAPKQWRDDDRQRFRVEAGVRLAAMRRVLHLHNEAHALGVGAFEASFITRTTGAGKDESVLVAVTAERRPMIDDALEQAISQLAETIGWTNEHAERQLLGRLAERTLPISDAPIVHTERMSPLPLAGTDG